jgi:hypothetical protein
MAVKTKAELVTQSDNTFLDNNTGQIVPTNHRSWNDDVLDTMFGAIAGISLTKTQFDDLVTNQELVEGCVYKITDYPLTSLLNAAEVYVTAKNSFQVYQQAYCYVYDSPNLLYINEDGSSAKVLMTLYKGVTGFNGELYDYIDQLLPTSFYEYGSDFRFHTNAGVGKYFQFEGKMAATFPDTILNHNIYGSYEDGPSTPKNRFKGFLPEDVVNQRKYFYPDHGNETTWGININNTFAGGAFSQLQIDNSLGFNTITNLYGNFQKVNDMIFGQIKFDANFAAHMPPPIVFNLPFQSLNGNSFMANGVGLDTSGAHEFLLIYSGVGMGGTMAQLDIRLIGNHIGNLDVKLCFSFSYSLGY